MTIDGKSVSKRTVVQKIDTIEIEEKSPIIEIPPSEGSSLGSLEKGIQTDPNEII